jgi:hypothetical protein
VDVFVLDQENMSKLVAGEAFEAATVMRRASELESEIGLPGDGRDWYVVLSNLHRVGNGQVVQANLQASPGR